MVEDNLRIATARREHAECQCDALRESGPVAVEEQEDAWAVVVSTLRGEMVTALLTALKQCLEEQEIRTVKVTLGEKSYVMEGSS
jgi:hypothetical protein